VPTRVQELVTLRVDQLGEEVSRLLSLAALAGTDCSLRLLRAASASWLSEEAFLEALDRALAGRILEEQGGSYAFRHPLPRSCCLLCCLLDSAALLEPRCRAAGCREARRRGCLSPGRRSRTDPRAGTCGLRPHLSRSQPGGSDRTRGGDPRAGERG
jgi:hypothetical protein